MSQQHLSSNITDVWLFGRADHTMAVNFPFCLQDLVASVVVFGNRSRVEDKEVFLFAVQQRMIVKQQINLLCIGAPTGFWTSQDHSRLSERLPRHVGNIQIVTYNEDLAYEGKISLRPNTQGIFAHRSALALPVDRASLETARETLIFGLTNLKVLTLTAPVDPIDFEQHLLATCKAISKLLDGFYSLQSIVIPLDCMSGTGELIWFLQDHWDLTTLEFTLPNTTNLSVYSSLRAVSISVAKEIWTLSYLRNVCVPDQFMSLDLLEQLGYLKELKWLKIKPDGRTGVGRFVEIVLRSELPKRQCFLALSHLDIGKKRISKSDLAVLRSRFPNVTIV